MKTAERPITRRMLEQLKKGKEKQESGDDKNSFLSMEDFQRSLAGLYKRGLIKVEKTSQDGKTFMRVFITKAGSKLVNRPDLL